MIASTIHIFLIEDDPKDRALFTGMLAESKKPNFELSTASRLTDALKVLTKEKFDIILLDLSLPETKGLNTLKKIHATVPNMPTVVLTRLDDEDLGIAAVREGAQEYLVKGQIDQYHLRRAICHALERHQIEEKLRESEEKYRALANQLQQANQELESFSYSVSHDLRAPLRAITGFAEIINRRHREVLSEDVQHYLDNITQAGKQMGWLIDDLLSYSRLGRGSLTSEPVDVNDLFADIQQSLVARLEENKAVLIVEPGMPVIQSNKGLLSQIFSNLITNAVTFHLPDVCPQVEITKTIKSGFITLCVADNGIGINQDMHDKIFDVFHRAVSPSDYPGTGIGLAIVKKSVDLLGGEVRLESVEGQGTQFFIDLPDTSKKKVSANRFWEDE